MTTTMRRRTTRSSRVEQVRMDPVRKTALLAGALYLLTFASSIPAKFLLIDPALATPDFMTAMGLDTPLLWGNLLDLVNALACVGTAVVLFPVVKRQHEAAALGFVTTRLIEAAVILIGIVSLLSVVTLRQDLVGTAGADAAAIATTGSALAAIYDWAFLLGPNVMAALNALLLGTLMYRSRLVPRLIPTMGLVGAPLLLGSSAAALFGLHTLADASHVLLVLPIFFWELSLGVYMVVKGFRPSPITSTPPVPVPVA